MIEPRSPALQTDSLLSEPLGNSLNNTRMHVCEVTSVVSDSVTQWTVACQALLSMGFPRQEYWNGLPFPPPGDLLDPGIEPESPVFPAMHVDSLPAETPGKPQTIPKDA